MVALRAFPPHTSLLPTSWLMHMVALSRQTGPALLYAKGIIALALGAWLLLPFDTLGTVDAYSALGAVFSNDLVLAALLLLSGAITLVAVARRTWLWARIGGMLLGILFATMFGALLAASPASLGAPMYGLMAVFSFWSIIGLSRNGTH